MSVSRGSRVSINFHHVPKLSGFWTHLSIDGKLPYGTVTPSRFKTITCWRNTALPHYEDADLSNVTLVSVTGVQVDAAQLALQRSMSSLRFRRVVLISSEPATRPDPAIDRIPIPPMNILEYSRFILQDLHRYVETTHALIVQADGFVLNPERWDPYWLEFDYIGAPWPPTLRVGPFTLQLRNQVGNGGFSLRSRRLLELTAPIDLATLRFPTRAEDVVTCHLLHDYLVGRGIRFPDVEAAARFAIEGEEASFGQTLATTFGFHGKHYLAQLAASGLPS